MSATGRKPGGRKTGGRVGGTPNRMTTAAKDAIALAADTLGGTERLAAWARSSAVNERAFWTQIYPRLLPHEVTGENGRALLPVIVTQIIERADAAKLLT